MNNNTSSDNSRKSSGFKLPTQIVFIAASCGFGVVSALNPLGVAGLPLSVIAAAMLLTLALSFRDTAPKAAAVFCAAPVSYIISAIIYISIFRLPAGQALILSLAALFPAALALPVYVTLRMKTGRAVSIAAAGFTASVLWIAYTALSVYAEYGALTSANIQLMFEDSFAPLRQAFSALTYEKDGETVAFYSQSDIEALIYNIKTLLIGSLTAMMIVTAYLVTLVSRFILSSFDLSGVLPESFRIRLRRVDTSDGPRVEMTRETVQWRIEPDSVTAIVFIAAYLVSILFASDSGGTLPVTVTATNLFVILSPCFIYAGVRDLLLGFGGGINGRGCIIFVLAAILVFINPLTLFLLLAAIGVSSVLRENHRKSQLNKIGKE